MSDQAAYFCPCGQPSADASGWCGRCVTETVIYTAERLDIVRLNIALGDDGSGAFRPITDIRETS